MVRDNFSHPFYNDISDEERGLPASDVGSLIFEPLDPSLAYQYKNFIRIKMMQLSTGSETTECKVLYVNELPVCASGLFREIFQVNVVCHPYRCCLFFSRHNLYLVGYGAGWVGHKLYAYEFDDGPRLGLPSIPGVSCRYRSREPFVINGNELFSKVKCIFNFRAGMDTEELISALRFFMVFFPESTRNKQILLHIFEALRITQDKPQLWCKKSFIVQDHWDVILKWSKMSKAAFLNDETIIPAETKITTMAALLDQISILKYIRPEKLRRLRLGLRGGGGRVNRGCGGGGDGVTDGEIGDESGADGEQRGEGDTDGERRGKGVADGERGGKGVADGSHDSDDSEGGEDDGLEGVVVAIEGVTPPSSSRFSMLSYREHSISHLEVTEDEIEYMQKMYLDMCQLQQKWCTIFMWQDGPLNEAMKNGDLLLVDEISLADGSVLKRLNSVLEPEKKLSLAEKGGSDLETVCAHANFFLLATMNPGEDYGKKELSPALLNRFTEIWVPSVNNIDDLRSISHKRILNPGLVDVVNVMLDFWEWFNHLETGRLLTVRDLLSWVSFINAMERSLSAKSALVHGAFLVLLDGLSLGTSISKSDAAEFRLKFGQDGSPWEFNLLYVYHSCEIVQGSNGNSKYNGFFNTIQRMRTAAVSVQVMALYEQVVEDKPFINPYPGLELTPKSLVIGVISIERYSCQSSGKSSNNLKILPGMHLCLEAVVQCTFVGPASSDIWHKIENVLLQLLSNLLICCDCLDPYSALTDKIISCKIFEMVFCSTPGKAQDLKHLSDEFLELVVAFGKWITDVQRMFDTDKQLHNLQKPMPLFIDELSNEYLKYMDTIIEHVGLSLIEPSTLYINYQGDEEFHNELIPGTVHKLLKSSRDCGLRTMPLNFWTQLILLTCGIEYLDLSLLHEIIGLKEVKTSDAKGSFLSSKISCYSNRLAYIRFSAADACFPGGSPFQEAIK